MENRILAFADAHLQPYRLRNDELIPEFCPVCRGGPNGDRHTFALNIRDGVYVCKRGTCGAKGRIEALAHQLGERITMSRDHNSQKTKQYTIPDT